VSNRPIVQFITLKYQLAIHIILACWLTFAIVTPLATGQLKYAGGYQCSLISGDVLHWLLGLVYYVITGCIAICGILAMLLYSIVRAKSIMILLNMKRLLFIIATYILVLALLLLLILYSFIERNQLSASLAEYYECLISLPSCIRPSSSLQPFGYAWYILSSAPFWFSMVYLFDSSTIRALGIWKQTASQSYFLVTEQNPEKEINDLRNM